MSFIYRGRPGYSRKLISAAYASAAVAALSGQIKEARAAVFEQTCSDKIIALGDGAPAGAPSQENSLLVTGQDANSFSVIEFGSPALAAPNVPAGEATAADVPPPSSLCANSPAGTASKGVLAMKAIQSTLTLPVPKKLPQIFNDEQLQMRELATKVGSQFSDAPGVRKAKLDEPAFIKLFTTLVLRESNFRSRAVSPAGARGLGQLMPATARHLGVKDTFAPEQNLVGAATYLTDMLDQFGSPELALAAYNAGPNAVVKHGGIPPYRETRQYVADIFHEVLREPAPSREEVEISDVARRGLAAFAADPAGISENPFDKILTEKAKAQPNIREHGLLAVVEDAEAAAFVNASSNLVPGVDAPTLPDENVDAETEKPVPAKRAATPQSPDLSTLPEPRKSGNTLSKSQLAMRELTIDAALRHIKAPGIRTAGLSEEAFVTLFVALIQRESSFNRRAVSQDGAKGLGQLTPDTVRALKLADPFAPKENLEAAATRLIRLLNQFGSPALALAAYNAGEEVIKDRAVIPESRGTRQLVADVLYDLESDPRPDFLTARFQAAMRMDVVLPGEDPLTGRLIGPAGRDAAAGGDLVSAHQGVEAPLRTAALADASFIDELLSTLNRIVGEVTHFLQSLYGNTLGRLWNGPGGTEQNNVSPAPTPPGSGMSQGETMATLLDSGSAENDGTASDDRHSGVAKVVAKLVKDPVGDPEPQRLEAVREEEDTSDGSSLGKKSDS